VATKKLKRAAACVLFSLLCISAGLAEQIVVEEGESRESKQSFLVPYAFNTVTLATAFGVGYVRNATFQPQDSFAITGYVTTNGSLGAFGGLHRVQVFSERWFFSPIFGVQKNDEQRFYGDFGFETGKPPSGSNQSNPLDFLSGKGWDSYLNLPFRYLFSIGAGSGEPVHQYTTRDGLLIDGATNGSDWNPFSGGRTFLEVKPFAQLRTLEITNDNVGFFPPGTGVNPGDTLRETTSGLEVALEFDNRDYPVNPSKGSWSRIGATRDFGWFNNSDSWTSLEADFRKYIGFGDSKLFGQQVLALAAWTAYIPTWDVVQVSPTEFNFENRPPSNKGATLGGVERLRGYPRGRFNDKAAVYYAAEARFVPRWNPFGSWPIIRQMPWRTWQVVAFGEIGRVAPDWNFSTLHEDMKWSAGAGIRALVSGGVVRLDIAFSEEDAFAWFMVGQAF
jgi:hypothetical protein